MSDNPYQAPVVQEVAVAALPLTDAESIRSSHIKHEASLKSVGFVYFLGGLITALGILGAFGVFGAMVSRSGAPGVGVQEIVIVVLLLLLSIGQLIAGWGLRKLRPWSKVLAAVVATVGLIKIPIGTLIGIYALYLIFSAKGRMILSPAYQEIVAQTPHIRYRTPMWIWILLLVLVLAIVLVFVAAWFMPVPASR